MDSDASKRAYELTLSESFGVSDQDGGQAGLGFVGFMLGVDGVGCGVVVGFLLVWLGWLMVYIAFALVLVGKTAGLLGRCPSTSHACRM